MAKDLIIQTGSFGSGFTRRVADPTVTLPVPNTPAAIRYWENKFRDRPGDVVDELGALQMKKVAWATELGNKLLGYK